MKCLLKILGSSKIHRKGYRITHGKMAALTCSDCQKWQFVPQLLLHQEFKQLGNATVGTARKGECELPRPLFSCVPGLESKSGALIGRVKVTCLTLGTREKEAGEISIQYIQLAVVLDLSQDLRSGSFSKHIKDFRSICFTWLMSTTDSDREEKRNSSYNISSLWGHLHKWKQPAHKP